MTHEELLAEARKLLNEYGNDPWMPELLQTTRELCEALEEATAIIEAVKAERANHPTCSKHPEEYEASCGWKNAMRAIDAALAKGATE